MTIFSLLFILLIYIQFYSVFVYGQNNKSLIFTLPNDTSITIKGPSVSNDNIQLIINASTAFAGIFTLFLGIRTFRQSQILKRKDILKDVIIPLMEEFNSDKLKLSKQILYKHTISGELGGDYPDSLYDKDDLNVILRSNENYKYINSTEEKIRKSFDDLLEFFVKLEYLLVIGVISIKDIDYFNRVIETAADDKNVISYLKFRSMPLYGKLNNKLDLYSECS
jgi:hypothetical protein